MLPTEALCSACELKQEKWQPQAVCKLAFEAMEFRGCLNAGESGKQNAACRGKEHRAMHMRVILRAIPAYLSCICCMFSITLLGMLN